MLAPGKRAPFNECRVWVANALRSASPILIDKTCLRRATAGEQGHDHTLARKCDPPRQVAPLNLPLLILLHHAGGIVIRGEL